jgi:uncharacterized membrane protein
MNVCARILVTGALAASLAASHARADLTYTKFDGPAPNDNGTLVSGINNNGSVDGVTVDANFNHQGFNGTPPGSFTTFVLPAGSSAAANQTILGGINDNNVVVGFTPSGTGTSDIYTINNGVVTHLTVPPGFGNTSARGINDAGFIVGNHFDRVTGQLVGYVRDAAGGFTTFTASQATTMTIPDAINNNGTIVGSYGTAIGSLAGFERAVDGTITLLATPTSIGGLAVTSITYQGINDFGVTAGTFLDGGNAFGFVRDAAGNFTEVVVPGGTIQNRVAGINDNGTVAGTYFDAGGDIQHGFIASPVTVPEPSSVALMGIGILAGLGHALRLRRRAVGA